MKICMVSEEFPLETPKGGISTYQWIISKQFAQMDHEIHVICKTFSSQDRVEYINGATVHFISDSFSKNKNNFDTEDYRLKVAKKMTELESIIDVFEVADWGAESHYYIKNRVKPIVVKLHTPLWVWRYYNKLKTNSYTKKLEIQEKHDILDADMVYSCSKSLKEIIINELDYTKEIAVVQNPYISSELPYSEKENMILFVGSLEERKGLLKLAEELNTFFSKNTTHKFIFIGKDTKRNDKDFSTKEYIYSIIENQYHNRVEFLGHLSQEEIKKILSRSACSVFPSLYENFPYVVLESMDAMCPTIGSKYGGIPEIINEENGWLCDPYIQHNISNVLLKVVSLDNKYIEKITLNAKNDLNTLSANEICLQTLDIYEQAIERFYNE